MGETADVKKVCPITRIEFRDFNSKDEAKKWATNDKLNWDFEDYEDDTYMLWTTEFDSLPVTNTAIEKSPCMNPTESYINDGYVPFAAERSMPKCTKSLTNGLINDPRYNNTGIQTNLNSLHEDNNINSLMISTFGMNFNVQNEAQKKSRQILGLWTRPTLSWKLSCEASADSTREDLMRAVNEPFEFPDRIFVAAIFAFICVGIEACACGCGIIGSANDGGSFE